MNGNLNSQPFYPLSLNVNTNNASAGHSQDLGWVQINLNGLFHANGVLDSLKRSIPGEQFVPNHNVIVSRADDPITAIMQGNFPTNRQQDSHRRESWLRLSQFQLKSIEHYNQLRLHQRQHGCSFLRKWMEHCVDASEMRRFGLLALEGIWCGREPNSFNLFSAIIVQHCIFEIDNLYGTPDATHSAIHDEAWKSRFPRDARQELDCVCQLFPIPEANHSNSQPPDMIPEIYDLQGIGGQAFDNVSQHQFPTEDDDVLSASPLYDRNQPYVRGSSGFPNMVFGSNSHLSSISPQASFETLMLQDTFPSLGMQNAPVFPYNQTHSLSPSYSQPPQPASLGQLKVSAPFKALNDALLKYGSGDQRFLYAFSASHIAGRSTRPPSSLEPGSEERKEQLRSCICEDFLDTLNPPDNSDDVVQSMVFTTKMAFREGTLNCLRLVETYLLHIGKNLLPPESYQYFRGVVLDRCSEISSMPRHKRFLYNGPTLHEEEYSQQYFESHRRNIPNGPCGIWSPEDLFGGLRHSDSKPSTDIRYLTPNPPYTYTTSDATSDISGPFSPTTGPVSSPGTSVSGTNRRCNICGKEYIGRSAATSLSRHKRKHQMNAKSHTCPYCSETVTRTDNLRTHIKNNHPGSLIPHGKQEWAKYSQASQSMSSQNR